MTRFRKCSLTRFPKRRINHCNDTERLFDSRCIAPANPMQCSALVAISPRPCQMIVASGCYRGIMQSGKSEKAVMGAVMIKCPDTGRDIPTGLVADSESFRATPVFFSRVYCPICRTQHEWFAQQAWVCEAEPVEVRNKAAA